MAIRPRTKTPAPRPITRTFYVFNPRATFLGGAAVRDDGSGNRVVVMTDADAQYWIDQGVIGDRPLNQQSPGAQAAIQQFMGSRAG